MQQVLNELLVALASFDCRRALALLAEAVAEYQADTRHPRLRLDAQGHRCRTHRRPRSPISPPSAACRKPPSPAQGPKSASGARSAPSHARQDVTVRALEPGGPAYFRLSPFSPLPLKNLTKCESPSSAPATWASSPAPALRTPAITCVCVDVDAGKIERLNAGRGARSTSRASMRSSSATRKPGASSSPPMRAKGVEHGLFQLIAVGTPPG